MNQLPVNCPSCGAPALGLVCEHCGRLTAHVTSFNEENRALDEFHNLIQKLAGDLDTGRENETEEQLEKRIERAEHLLQTGFIPDHKSVLIEAGVYCLPFIDGYTNVALAALARLQAITTKLKLMPRDEQVQNAFAEFEQKIEKRKASNEAFDRNLTIIFSICGLLVLGLFGGLVWYIASDFGWSTGICGAVLIVFMLLGWLFGSGKK